MMSQMNTVIHKEASSERTCINPKALQNLWIGTWTYSYLLIYNNITMET